MSRPGVFPQIGVLGDTEEEAGVLYQGRVQVWRALRAEGERAP